jgi:TRAP-type C4-dicarboxylate transport system permease small subunit
LLAILNKGADGLTRLSALIGTLGLITEVVVILVDVVGRAFHHPLTGAQDISTMAMVLLVFGGMALCDRIGGHISVDLFETSIIGLPKVYFQYFIVAASLITAFGMLLRALSLSLGQAMPKEAA